MGRPVDRKRWECDWLMARLLENGERPARDVLDAFREKGFNENDYRVTRYRLGAKVRWTGYKGIWMVGLPDNKPAYMLDECGPPRVPRTKVIVRKMEPEEIAVLRKRLNTKILEVDKWMGRVFDYKPWEVHGKGVVPTADITGRGMGVLAREGGL